MEFKSYLDDLFKDLSAKVAHLDKQKQDAEFALCSAVGTVIERKGLVPDLSNERTIEILQGSSGEVVNIAARAIWQGRKAKQRERDRRREVPLKISSPEDYEFKDYQGEEITRLVMYTLGSTTFEVAISKVDDKNVYVRYKETKNHWLETNEAEYDRFVGKHAAKIELRILHDDGRMPTPGRVSRDLGIPFETARKRLEEKKKTIAKAKRRIQNEKEKK